MIYIHWAYKVKNVQLNVSHKQWELAGYFYTAWLIVSGTSIQH